MKLLFPKLFAHVPVEGWEAWAGLIREEVAKEGLCPPVGPVVVEAENEEGKIKLEAFPASFPSFSPPLGPALGPRQKHASVCTHASPSPWLREPPQPRLVDKPRPSAVPLLVQYLRIRV
jgi:hypothetical protein